MVELRFSCRYRKMPDLGGATILLEVIPVGQPLSGPFVGYDTATAPGQTLSSTVETNKAKMLRGGSWLMLILSTREADGREHLWTTIRPRKAATEKRFMAARGKPVKIILPGDVVCSRRTTPFIKRFKSDADTVCPGFYNLTLATGCLGKCTWCYLQGTLRGQKFVRVYDNPWEKVQAELEAAGPGVFNCGELADSLMVEPPLLKPAIEWFRGQEDKTLLMVAKGGMGHLLGVRPHPRAILSASVNAAPVAQEYERKTPPPANRLFDLNLLKYLGWRVRVRLDPVISLLGFSGAYQPICERIAEMKPERVTVGSLRPYPPVAARLPEELKRNLVRDVDGRMRYPVAWRVGTYERIAEWLGFQPALCKETREVWDALGWDWAKCNCQE